MHRWKHWAPWSPVAGLVVLYVLYRQIYDRAGIDDVPLDVPAEAWRSLPGPEAAVADLAARLTWGIAVLAFCLAFLAALVMCLLVTWKASPLRRRVFVVVGAVLVSSLGIVAGLMGNPLTLPELADVLEEGFRRMGLADGSFLLHFFNGLAMSVALLLTFAASATLLDPASGNRDTEHLKRQARRLRHVLYAGAAVLIAGSAQAAAMHRLPVAYLNEPWAHALEAAAQTAALATGTLWTLFLAAVYLPAATILRERFVREAREALPEAGDAEHKKWLADHGLDLSPAQQLKRVVAVLGPLLTSLPLAGLFDLLAG